MTGIYARVFDSGELANTAMYQPFKANKNMALRCIRTWLAFVDNPTVDNFTAKIYSDRTDSVSHAPGVLIATSTNTLTKAEIITLANGFKEVPFMFDDINLQENTWYNLVINAGTYTPSASSYVAWKSSFPDPVYPTGLDISAIKLGSSPYAITIIGSEY
jgi:hypothetical protein